MAGQSFGLVDIWRSVECSIHDLDPVLVRDVERWRDAVICLSPGVCPGGLHGCCAREIITQTSSFHELSDGICQDISALEEPLVEQVSPVFHGNSRLPDWRNRTTVD
jgi:hypothetical protein